MEWRGFFVVFGAIFLAELGDKTQLATLLFSIEQRIPRPVVFLGAASALIGTTALAVLLGGWMGRFLPPKVLRWAAGLGFLMVGLWILFGERG